MPVITRKAVDAFLSDALLAAVPPSGESGDRFTGTDLAFTLLITARMLAVFRTPGRDWRAYLDYVCDVLDATAHLEPSLIPALLSRAWSLA